VHLTRKILLSAAALLIPTAMVVGIGASAAYAGSIVANGTITCTGIAGTITFKPPLKLTGPATDTTTIKVTLSKCKTTGNTNLKPGTITGSTTHVTKTTKGKGCSGLGTSMAETLPGTWKDSNKQSIAATTTAFSGYMAGSNSKGDEGFVLPNTGGTGTSTGSFATTSAAAAVYSNQTAKQIATACKKGLAKLTLTSGSATV
jgi:hypothetical protein